MVQVESRTIPTNREQFLALVRWAAEHAVDYPNGVVWVSPKAYKINFFTGFCAVESADHSMALAALRSAKALLRVSAEPRLEIVQTVAGTKQIDAAMDELDTSMQLPMGKCTKGIAWRRPPAQGGTISHSMSSQSFGPLCPFILYRGSSPSRVSGPDLRANLLSNGQDLTVAVQVLPIRPESRPRNRQRRGLQIGADFARGFRHAR